MSRHFGLTVLSVFVLVLLTLATVSGRWAKSRNEAATWDETGIWSYCQCFDLLWNNCKANDTYLRVVQGFSIIAALCEWFAVFILAREHHCARGCKNHFTGALGLYVLAVVANIISWATYAAYFRKQDICSSNQLSIKELGFHLSWGFGVRLIETGLLLLLLVLVGVLSSKGSDRTILHLLAYFVALTVLVCTLLTTSGRGWAWQTHTNEPNVNNELGLFDGCQCIEQFSLSCTDAKERVRTFEVFSVVSIFFTAILLLKLSRGTECARTLTLSRVVSGLGWIANCIVLVTFTEYVKGSWCNADPIYNAQSLHWAYGAIVAALIIQTLVFLGLFTVSATECPKEEEKKEVAATEPTA